MVSRTSDCHSYDTKCYGCSAPSGEFDLISSRSITTSLVSRVFEIDNRSVIAKMSESIESNYQNHS